LGHFLLQSKTKKERIHMARKHHVGGKKGGKKHAKKGRGRKHHSKKSMIKG
jgi:hypothetical protein